MKREGWGGGGKWEGDAARVGINLNDKQSAPVFPVC